MRGRSVVLSLALLCAAPAFAQISGDYVEFRTADVFTGPCTANGEVNLTGHEAVLGWRVAGGRWAGVELGGMSVVAVVRASATLGDAFAGPLPAKTVFLVDERANEAQRAALVQLAQKQTNGLLRDVVAIEAVPIEFAATAHGAVNLRAGNLTTIATRPIHEGDLFCHNESVYYEPLASMLDHAMPAVVTLGSYSGGYLGKTWKERGRRGAFTGSFSF